MRLLAGTGVLLVLALSGPGVARGETTATTTFGSPGVYPFAVPPGVRAITVTAVGAAGGAVCEISNGGDGASVTATVAVSPGDQLYAGVGGPGASLCNLGPGGTAGFGGGGAGGDVPSGTLTGLAGSGGGGASLVGAASPSPGFPPLVVAGGGGGAGAGAKGGSAGSPGEGRSCANCVPGGGGGPGTSISGGAGGSSDQATHPGDLPGVAGSLGLGGHGGSCTKAEPLCAGGGGGGGGYYGGGGGGSANVVSLGGPNYLNIGAGGGGGASFTVPGSTNVSAALTSAPPRVTITFPVPKPDASLTAMHFGIQAPGTAGPAQRLTVSNKGSASLVVSGVLLSGADPDDFLIGDRCQEPVLVGSSCEVGVRFYPQTTGARSATLTLLTNAPTPPAAVTLAGGISAGARGPAGEVELLTCRAITTELTASGRAAPVSTEDTCTGELIRGAVKFTAAGTSTRATLGRGPLLYASGASVATGIGGSELVLTDRRPLKPGIYTLTLRHRRGRRWVAQLLGVVLR